MGVERGVETDEADGGVGREGRLTKRERESEGAGGGWRGGIKQTGEWGGRGD